MILKKCYLIKNSCYVADEKIIGNPTGIVVHSTGCDNNKLKRYVQPVREQPCYDEVIADIGKNTESSDWNRDKYQMKRSVCVHAFIGLNANGVVETYQTLPYDMCCWGIGNGSKGSYNYNPTARIQFEICEDDLKNEDYFNKAMKEAQEYCAYLCKQFSLPVSAICSHKEAHKLGYGSDHRDCDHWLAVYNKDMNWFRDEVQKILTPPKTTYYCVQVGAYTVKKNAEKKAQELKDKGFTSVYITTKEV